MLAFLLTLCATLFLLLLNANWKPHMQDELMEREAIDCAIAISLSEQDHKWKNPIGKFCSLPVLRLNMIQLLSGQVW